MPAVAAHVLQQELDGVPGRGCSRRGCGVGAVARRLKQHRHTPLIAVGCRAHPVAAKLLPAVAYASFCRVGDMIPAATIRHAVEHREMALVPMEYRRERRLSQLPRRQPRHDSRQPHARGGASQPVHRHTRRCRRASPVKLGQGDRHPVVAAHHRQRCHAALHTVTLTHKREHLLMECLQAVFLVLTGTGTLVATARGVEVVAHGQHSLTIVVVDDAICMHDA